MYEEMNDDFDCLFKKCYPSFNADDYNNYLCREHSF